MSNFDHKLKQTKQKAQRITQPSTSDQGGGLAAYEQLFENIELAKEHQVNMARKFFPMLQDVRNQRFFFEELNRQLEAHNVTVRDVKLIDPERDNQFFLEAQSSLYSDQTAQPKAALKSADTDS